MDGTFCMDGISMVHKKDHPMGSCLQLQVSGYGLSSISSLLERLLEIYTLVGQDDAVCYFKTKDGLHPGQNQDLVLHHVAKKGLASKKILCIYFVLFTDEKLLLRFCLLFFAVQVPKECGPLAKGGTSTKGFSFNAPQGLPWNGRHDERHVHHPQQCAGHGGHPRPGPHRVLSRRPSPSLPDCIRRPEDFLPAFCTPENLSGDPPGKLFPVLADLLLLEVVRVSGTGRLGK